MGADRIRREAGRLEVRHADPRRHPGGGPRRAPVHAADPVDQHRVLHRDDRAALARADRVVVLNETLPSRKGNAHRPRKPWPRTAASAVRIRRPPTPRWDRPHRGSERRHKRQQPLAAPSTANPTQQEPKDRRHEKHKEQPPPLEQAKNRKPRTTQGKAKNQNAKSIPKTQTKQPHNLNRPQTRLPPRQSPDEARTTPKAQTKSAAGRKPRPGTPQRQGGSNPRTVGGMGGSAPQTKNGKGHICDFRRYGPSTLVVPTGFEPALPP